MRKCEFCKCVKEDIRECFECCEFDYMLEVEKMSDYEEYREEYIEYLERFYED